MDVIEYTPTRDQYAYTFGGVASAMRVRPGSALTAAMRVVETTGERFSLRPQLTIQLPNGRAAVLVVRVCFNRRDDADRRRASEGHRAMLSSALAAGFPPWRLGIEDMPLLGQGGVDMALPRRLKALLDPHGVIAPGRYV